MEIFSVIFLFSTPVPSQESKNPLFLSYVSLLLVDFWLRATGQGRGNS